MRNKTKWGQMSFDDISDTQRAAWEEIQGKVTGHRRKVLEVLSTFGPATGYEVASRLGWYSYRTLPRITELHKFGIVKDSGLRRVNPESGKNTIVWQICHPS